MAVTKNDMLILGLALTNRVKYLTVHISGWYPSVLVHASGPTPTHPISNKNI